MDGDAFFVSCEVAKNPKLKGKPVVTGEERGIVSALSYEAKALGITRGMSIYKVKKDYPRVIVVPGDYKSYAKYSGMMFDIVRRYADDVEEYSIDECFADLTGLDKPLKMSYEEIGQRIKKEINDELGLSVSVGLASSKVLAKVASKYVKPNGFTIIEKNIINHSFVQKNIKEKFGYPAVIKPNDEGSTIGLTICKNESEVPAAIEKAANCSKKILVEEYIPGRELTVAILDQKALPVLEIKPKSGFYDYENKYTSGRTDYIVPADIPNQVSEHLQKQAVMAFDSIGCESYARIDFRLTDEYKFYCLEVNTLPGMTSTSLVPKMAKAAGISFEELIDRIIKNSF